MISESVTHNNRSERARYDEILIDRFNAGDEKAFEELVVRYRPQVVLHAFKMIRNMEDAEEIASDTFVRIHRALKDFRGDSAFTTWMYQIATNLARNRFWFWWRRKRDKSVPFDAPINGGEDDLTLAEVIPEHLESVPNMLENREFVDLVATCMELLNERHREILIMRTVQNLSYEEIAALIGIPVGSVKSRIARARDSLGKHLQEQSGFELAAFRQS